MWSFYPELLAARVPRYTSYPTAAEFAALDGQTAMDEALAILEAEARTALYVHIPYCHQICWYCGCNTGAANRAGRLESYLEMLLADIARSGAQSGRHRVASIAFGGGSPNALSPGQLLRLIQGLRQSFSTETATLSIELDPRTLTNEYCGTLGAVGVERASLGVQTFAPHVQQRIGRVQPEAMIERAADRLRSAGVGSVNFDLMYGLPAQSLADVEETLTATCAIRPERIAFFGYAHIPQLLPRQRRIDGSELPDAAMRFQQAALGHDILTAAGYEAIGFDHFALPQDPLAIAAANGSLRRNFQGFTDDCAEATIGLGASAISSFPDRLLQSEKNAGRYGMIVGAGGFPQTRGVFRSAADRLRATLVEDLLCGRSIDLSPLPDVDTVLNFLPPFAARGLVHLEGKNLAIAPEGIAYSRVIASCLDSYRQPGAHRFSHAV